MDSSWSTVTNDPGTLNQIAQALGYQSADQLPPVSSLSGDQVATLTVELTSELAQKVYDSSYDATSPTLDPPAVNANDRNLALQLEEMQAVLSHLFLKFEDESSTDTEERMHAQTKERIAKRDEALKKYEHAKNASKVSKWLGLAGAIMGVVVAAAVAVLTGGAGIALVALAIAAVSLTVTALEDTGTMDKMLDDMGIHDPKTRMWVEVGISAALMVASLATGYGAYKALTGMTEISSLIQTVSDGMEVSAEATQAAVKTTQLVASTIGILTSIGGGAAGIDAAAENYSSTKDSAKLQEMQAFLQMLESYLEQVTGEIKKALQQQEQFVTQVPEDIQKTVNESHAQIFATSPA